MGWEDDEPMFEIVDDEPRERTCNQDNPVFELVEDDWCKGCGAEIALDCTCDD